MLVTSVLLRYCGCLALFSVAVFVYVAHGFCFAGGLLFVDVLVLRFSGLVVVVVITCLLTVTLWFGGGCCLSLLVGLVCG